MRLDRVKRNRDIDEILMLIKATNQNDVKWHIKYQSSLFNDDDVSKLFVSSYRNHMYYLKQVYNVNMASIVEDVQSYLYKINENKILYEFDNVYLIDKLLDEIIRDLDKTYNLIIHLEKIQMPLQLKEKYDISKLPKVYGEKIFTNIDLEIEIQEVEHQDERKYFLIYVNRKKNVTEDDFDKNNSLLIDFEEDNFFFDVVFRNDALLFLRHNYINDENLIESSKLRVLKELKEQFLIVE